MLNGLITGFLPWIFYFIFAGYKAYQLDFGIALALAAVVITNLTQLKKGFILSWVTLLFFAFMAVAVIGFKNTWIIQHAWVLSNMTFAFTAWGSLLAGCPFTLQYAKEQVPPAKWNSPLFIQINQILTLVWALAFTVATLSHLVYLQYLNHHYWIHEAISNGSTFIATLFTIKFPEWFKNRKLIEKTAQSPFLQGNFAPVQDERNDQELPVKGKIPEDLCGVYMRNGSNPAFPPLSYTYPFDGDGMIHAIYLKDGKASYRNRFVETKGLQAERRAGKALYGGILNPIVPDTQWIGEHGDPGPFKNGAFIHIIHHAKDFLAMWEGGPAYVMDRDLNTLGEWSPGAIDRAINVGPHTRLDPVSGELWLINYDLTPPYLTVYCIDAQGQLIKQVNIDKKYPTMMHDFVLTQNHVIFFDCPVVLDTKAFMTGGAGLQWRPELKTQIGLMSRKTHEVQWIKTDPFFVFHLANAYENNDEIIIDLIKYAHFSFKAEGPEKNAHPHLSRIKINSHSQTLTHEELGKEIMEFPRIREDYNTLPHRFIYTAGKLHDDIPHFHALIKYDVHLKTSTSHDFGKNCEIGEAVFVPKKNSNAEDDGYLMLFIYDNLKKSSEFVILDAQHVTHEPVAQIQLLRRVPHGLHGTWVNFEPDTDKTYNSINNL